MKYYWLALGIGAVVLALVVPAAGVEKAGRANLELRALPVSDDADGSVTLEVVYHPSALRITAVQFDLEYGAASSVTVVAGPIAELAAKTLAVAATGLHCTRVLVFGFSPEVLQDGVLAVLKVAMREDSVEPLATRLTSIVAVGQDDSVEQLAPVQFTEPRRAFESRVALNRQFSRSNDVQLQAYATIPCSPDVNGDGRIDVADLQLLTVMAPGQTYGRCDLNGDGRTDEADFILVLNSILAGARGTVLQTPAGRRNQ